MGKGNGNRLSTCPWSGVRYDATGVCYDRANREKIPTLSWPGMESSGGFRGKLGGFPEKTTLEKVIVQRCHNSRRQGPKSTVLSPVFKAMSLACRRKGTHLQKTQCFAPKEINVAPKEINVARIASFGHGHPRGSPCVHTTESGRKEAEAFLRQGFGPRPSPRPSAGRRGKALAAGAEKYFVATGIN